MAIQHTRFERFLGIDISPTCVQMCQEMVEQRIPESKDRIEVREQDFFQYDGPVCDAVVLGEILEHVEEPKKFLDKIHEITHGGSFIYIVTVVNCPQKDHIYQFRTVEEIESLYQSAGFDIDDRIVFSTNGCSLEKAIKWQTAIMTAHVLKRR